MRTTARSLSALASALLLAASAVTMSGCGAPKVPDSDRPPITVDVVVEYDAQTKATKWTSSQGLPDKLVQLSKKNRDTVQWSSLSGLVYVDKWSPELPFPEPPKHENNKLKSKPPKMKGKFEYLATLVLSGNDPSNPSNHIKIDPRIEVIE